MSLIKLKKSKKINKKRLVSAILIPLVVFCVNLLLNVAEITHYSVESEEIGQSFTIALIADLHCTDYGKNQHRLVRSIKEGNPDLILFAGDIFHHFGGLEQGFTLIAECAEIAPVYYVAGNHEERHKNYLKIIETVRENGATVLENEYVLLDINGNDVVLLGAKRSNSVGSGLLDEVNELDGYKIVLSHYPMGHLLYRDYDFDLMLSGHTHGGQVRIPLLAPKGLYTPCQGVFPRYTGGLYEITENFSLIVSRGLAKNYTAMFRVNNRPELVFVEVRGEE
jgi:hypothetical protein